MRLSRLFVDMSLKVGEEILLPKESAHYLLNVLRLRVGTSVILFNGQGGEYVANLIAATKKSATLQLIEYNAIERESNLQLTLVQAISRPEHFSYTLQKAVELGVQRIVPLITERSPPIDKSKISKREQHWRKIIINACEQCGKNRLPQLHEVLSLNAWLSQPQPGLSLVLSPTGKKRLLDFQLESKAQALNELESKAQALNELESKAQALNELESKAQALNLESKALALDLESKALALNKLESKAQALNELESKAQALDLESKALALDLESKALALNELESKALALNQIKRDFITVFIGAEGGLTETEIEQAKIAGYQDIRFGTRILRTETAATAILAVCQTLWGDLTL